MTITVQGISLSDIEREIGVRHPEIEVDFIYRPMKEFEGPPWNRVPNERIGACIAVRDGETRIIHDVGEAMAYIQRLFDERREACEENAQRHREYLKSKESP